jgi:hypothetical protein
MSFFLLILTEQYITEKKFVKETETIRLQEYYMLCSVKQAEALLREEHLPEAGGMSYLRGEVAFQKQGLSANMDQVTFTLTMDSGEKAVGIGQYDKEKGAMVKWLEKN